MKEHGSAVEWVRHYENGQVWSKINYKDGEKNGESVYYYENGLIKNKWNWKDGKEHGEWVYYDENGQVTGRGWNEH